MKTSKNVQIYLAQFDGVMVLEYKFTPIKNDDENVKYGF
ncbi:hypothetical protein GLIP_1691 [Aliiglaciecola lipolytica E3]|uniref:Uncharacterized protein n=1 Tax=Aliiglaciecola lipolytica E3 TaxID=1127673 RepID=K6X114_9ALTE|nr:hypothetical protein GLIP_1691 [Aliiglaciecola lipolytica E3]